MVPFKVNPPAMATKARLPVMSSVPSRVTPERVPPLEVATRVGAACQVDRAAVDRAAHQDEGQP